MEVQPKLSLWCRLMDLSPKYNELEFGQGYNLVCLLVTDGGLAPRNEVQDEMGWRTISKI